jgi:26S proteasome regulatory subunit N1
VKKTTMPELEPSKQMTKEEARKKDEEEAAKKKAEKALEDEEEMSPEDKALLEGLELAVTRTTDADEQIVLNALEHLRTEIRTATTSMTSVPKPLKFLRPHYQTLKDTHEAISAGPAKVQLADILAVLAMTMAEPGKRESLSYKLRGDPTDLGSWGHEFVRSLAGEIGQEYDARSVKAAEDGLEKDAEQEGMQDILNLVKVIVPFHLSHRAEAEAVDLLIEVQQLKILLEEGQKIDEDNFERICLYLLRCADFMSDPEDYEEVNHTAYTIYTGQASYTNALRVALRMQDMDRVKATMDACEDGTVKNQMAFLLARHRCNYEDDDDDDLNEIIGNNKLSENFLALARDLDVMEPKTPEQIYKSHLADTAGFTRRANAAKEVESARGNLANTFVNSFVNAGYMKDELMTPEDSQWIHKNKEHGMMSATASLGMVLLWDIDEGLAQLDKYLYTKEDYITAGAVLGFGVVASGIRNESDPIKAVVNEYLTSASSIVKCAACAALGIAYAGSAREDLMEDLLPVAQDGDATMSEVALAALSLGHVFVGSCNEDVGFALVTRLMESSDADLDHPMARFLCLGLGLLFFGQMEKCEGMLEVVKTVEHKMGKYAAVTLESCAYAGTGNVLKIQELLHLCAGHLHEDAEHQAAAVLGIALVALGEDVGSEMALRIFDHLLQYCELPIKRALPLALALLNMSNPDYSFVDQMSRLSHDNDPEVAQAAILGMGLLGAGSNNSRIAGLLRQLAEHSRDPNHTFVVRIAQGFLHMGKGLIGLTPYHSDRLLLSGVGMAGILTVLHACLDMKNTILDKVHYILFYVTGAMNPRMLLTVDEDLQPLPVTVRVGQAVETVGQAGRPKGISGFQTHTTPVLLATTERAELATPEYLLTGSQLEGIVSLKELFFLFFFMD